MTAETSPRLLDTPERVLAFPLRGVYLIEASAGTGKTYTIANLYLRHVLSGVSVGQLLVVTFTEAATQELRGRIRARLAEALWWLERAGSGAQAGTHLPAEPKDDFLRTLLAFLRSADVPEPDLARRRLRLAVRSMDEAAIYTIHGFCQRVLSELAFHSGQAFQLEVLTNDHDLWDAALADWWRRTAYPLAQGRARLFRDTLVGFEELRTLVAPLLGPQPPRLLPEVEDLASVLARTDAATPVIAKLAAGWRAQGNRLRELLLSSPGLKRAQGTPYRPDDLELSLTQIGVWFAALEAAAFRPPPAGFEVLTPACLARHAKKKADPALADPYFQACGELWDELCRLRHIHRN